MFIHETHSFYIIAKLDNCKNAPDGYLEKKMAIFNQVMHNVGIVKVANMDNLWQLNEVMYATSRDVLDILSNEMIRLVSKDETIAASEKKLYEISSLNDSIVVSEYLQDNTFILK